LVVLTPLFFGPGLVKVLGAPAWVTGPVDTAQGVALVILAYVGYYAGRRYRLSRTLWRGIRGGLGGQPSRYAKEAFLSGLWLVLTLGFYLPWQRVRLWRYEANHTRFGDRSFTFFGNGRKLLRTYLASLATAVGGSIAIAAAIHISGIGRLLVTYATDPFVIAAAAVAALTLLSSVGGFALVLFDAHWMRLQALGTSFGDVRLSAEINAFQLLRLRLGNLLIRVATLGLGWPFVAQRTLRFLCEAVTVHAADSLDELTQRPGAARPPAGGLAQLLDAGGFA
jgi:uncharacterized membrane protein YjgN (DUF898 family)